MTKPSLAKNTTMLYVLTLSSYVFTIITIPYQTRILGPEIFGLLGIVAAVMMFVGLLLDFGFMLYGTGEVSRLRSSKYHIRALYSSVIHIKLILSVLCIIMLSISFLYVPFVSEHVTLFILYLLAFITQALLPDFLYRGMENMAPITIRSVLARSLFVVLIFIFLRTSDQYLLVPLFLLISNVLALVISFIDVYKRFGIKVSKVEYRTLFITFTSSSQFFLSRIASTVYGASSTLIVSAVAPGATVGYFASADKLVTAAKLGVSPVADSIYPYMIATKNYRLLKKLTIAMSLFAVAGCVVVFFNARFVCELLFGHEFAGSAPILQALLPIIAIAPAHYLLGFPALSPIRLHNHANYSIFISAGVYVLCMAVLLLTSTAITPVAVALAMVASELTSVAYRTFIVIMARYRWGLI